MVGAVGPLLADDALDEAGADVPDELVTAGPGP